VATPARDGTHVDALCGNGIACASTMAGDRLWVKFIEPSPLGFGHSRRLCRRSRQHLDCIGKRRAPAARGV
jgi:hypothetical protein